MKLLRLENPRVPGVVHAAKDHWRVVPLCFASTKRTYVAHEGDFNEITCVPCRAAVRKREKALASDGSKGEEVYLPDANLC